MAIAGYEPTPADEMPEPAVQRRGVVDPDPEMPADGSLIGNVTKGSPPVDLEMRQTPDGSAVGFKLTQGRGGVQVIAFRELAESLAPMLKSIVGERVSVWGTVDLVPWVKDGKDMPPFRRLTLERIQTEDWTMPPVEAAA